MVAAEFVLPLIIDKSLEALSHGPCAGGLQAFAGGFGMGYWEQVGEENRRTPPPSRFKRLGTGLALCLIGLAVWVIEFSGLFRYLWQYF
jgi:hypothetical protein